MDSRRQHY